MLLAQAHVHARDGAAALATLGRFDSAATDALGMEAQAQLHRWRAVALEQESRSIEAAAEERLARTLLQRVETGLPEEYRGTFASRRNIRDVASAGADEGGVEHGPA
jgi:hypothetical protein